MMALQMNYMGAQQQQPNNGLAARQQKDAQTWKQMLDVAKMDEKTAAGFGLGRLLSQWWNRYQEKRNDPNNQAWEAANKQKGEYDSFDAQINDIAGQITGLQQANDAIDNPQPQYNLANDVQTVGQNLAAQGYQNPADEAFRAKSLPDMAFFDGVKKEKNNQQIEALKAKQAELTQKRDAIGQMLAQSGIFGLTPKEEAMQQAGVNNRYLTGLLNFQNAYADAQSRGDQAGMDAAHAGAMDWREQGRAAGINPALLDERITPDQIQNLIAQNEMDSVFNSITPDEMYQTAFNRARAGGASFRQAHAIAGETASRYQADRTAAMARSITNYGRGQDGALNAQGAVGLAMLGRENPEMANALANMLPGPKDTFKIGAQEKLMGTKDKYTKENMVLGGKIDMEKAAQKHAYDEETANNNLARAAKQMEIAMNVQAMGIQAQAQARASIAAALNLTGDARTRYITTGHIDAPKSAGSGKGSGAGFDSKQGEFLQKERAYAQEQLDAAKTEGDEAKVKEWTEKLANINAQLEDIRTGGSSGGTGASSYGDIQNDYNAFASYYQAALDESNGSYNEQVIADARRTNPEFAERFIGDYYTGGGDARSSTPKTEQPEPQKESRAKWTGTGASGYGGSSQGYNPGRDSGFAKAIGGVWDNIKKAVAPTMLPVTDANGKVLYYINGD